MVIAFYLGLMNFRGVVNSTFQYALYNEKILRNKSLIFYDPNNDFNEIEVVNKFKKKFKIIGVSNFQEIDNYKDNYKIDYLFLQKGGAKDSFHSQKIKTLVLAVYPQKLSEIHGHRYAYISEWLSKNFSNQKIPSIPYIVSLNKTKRNLKKKLKIKNSQLVFGCHGGESSFDLRFVHDVVQYIAKERKDIVFLFLNINKFCKHPRIKFLKGTSNEIFKKEFINTCDAMIYGRSLGESFGLACGEFAIENKPVISYKFNRHRSHKYNISANFFREYSSFSTLSKIILNFKKEGIKKTKSKYALNKPKKIMKLFKKYFLTEYDQLDISIIDIFKNYFSHLKMNYLYLRHKIYNHYYNLIESKILKRKINLN